MPYDLDTNLVELLPPWYRDILDYQEICQTEKAELDALVEKINAVFNNFSFQTMDSSSVLQWEKLLNIFSDPETESLEFRRTRLINRMASRPPFTMRFLEQKLDTLIGEGKYKITAIDDFTLGIEINAESQPYALEVAYLVNKIKPAHILYAPSAYLKSNVLLSDSESYGVLSYQYSLGAWKLGESSFAEVGEYEVIKTATTSSIQDILLGDTANYIKSKIAKARINESTLITSINKSVSDSTLTISYVVNHATASEITKIELLNSDDDVVISSSVYVPVVQTVTLRHIIPVNEGVEEA